MPRSKEANTILIGLALIGWSVLAAYFVISFAWGGLLVGPMIERALWFSPAIVALAAGSTAVSIGVGRMLCRRPGRL